MKTLIKSFSVWCWCLCMCTLVFAEKQEIPQKDLLKSNQEIIDHEAEAKKAKLQKMSDYKNAALKAKLEKDEKEAAAKAAEIESNFNPTLEADKKEAKLKNQKKATFEKNEAIRDAKLLKLQNEKKATFEKNEALYDSKLLKLQNEKKASYEKNIELKNKKLEALKLDHKENHRTVPFSDFPMGQLITVGENGARDGVISATVWSIDDWDNEIRYMLLKTGDWWIMCPPDETAPDFTVFGGGALGVENFECAVPAGEYMFVLGDTFGDGGAVADVSVNGTYAGSLNSADAIVGDWDGDRTVSAELPLDSSGW